MSITHHIDTSTLMSFAAGSLGEALSAVTAAHLDMCAACRAELRLLDEIGSALVDDLAPSPLDSAPPTMQLRRLEAEVRAEAPAIARSGSDVPLPLQRFIGARLDDVSWSRLGIGVWQHRLRLSSKASGDLRLLRIAPGRAVPEHGHTGNEMTLVLKGAYSDALGTFRRGDLADLDEEIEHQPVADAQEGCICLVASDAPLRFKGLMGRLTQPFTRI
ncbi:MAG: ChrR family anti-sigma-E factor [Hyphomicrobiaceae bacterium]